MARPADEQVRRAKRHLENVVYWISRYKMQGTDVDPQLRAAFEKVLGEENVTDLPVYGINTFGEMATMIRDGRSLEQIQKRYERNPYLTDIMRDANLVSIIRAIVLAENFSERE